MRPISLLCALALAAAVPAAIYAQDGGSEALKPTLVAVSKKKVVKPTGPPAKVLFGAAKTPAPMAARAIGFYAKGCLAGAKALPIDGPAWRASTFLIASRMMHRSRLFPCGPMRSPGETK